MTRRANRSARKTRRLAESALRAAEAVKQKVDKDHRQLATLIESVRPKEETETPKRFVLLVLSAVACAAVVTVAASLFPAGFSTPPPNLAVPGVAGLYVWANALNERQTDALSDPGVSLRVIADQQSTKLEYVATFPKELAGDRYVLGLSGIAVLKDLQADAPDISNEYPECRAESQDKRSTPVSCQLITGIVPSETAPSAWPCRSPGSDKTVSIRLTGTSIVNSSYDWANHITSLPYLGNIESFASGSVDSIVTGTFGQNFPPLHLTTCYHLRLNPQWTAYTPNLPPTSHIGDGMSWDPASNMASYLVVSTERSANWKGNALLGVLGVFGPSFLSLAVLAVGSAQRLRSQSRRRRMLADSQ